MYSVLDRFGVYRVLYGPNQAYGMECLEAILLVPICIPLLSFPLPYANSRLAPK